MNNHLANAIIQTMLTVNVIVISVQYQIPVMDPLTGVVKNRQTMIEVLRIYIFLSWQLINNIYLAVIID